MLGNGCGIRSVRERASVNSRRQSAEEPWKLRLVAVAGSSGGGTALREILACLPADFPAPILYVQHLRFPNLGNLARVLQHRTALKVCWAQHGDRLTAGTVYVCPVGRSFVVRADGTIALDDLASRSDSLHAADRLFASAAAHHGDRAMAIVLSGAGWDGKEGICAVRKRQGAVLVQDEVSAFVWGMPKAALETGCVDLVLSPQEIAPLLLNLVRDAHSLAVLRASMATLSSGKGPDVPPPLHDTLEAILDTALTKYETDLGNIQLADPESGALAIVAQRGLGLDFLSHFRTVRSEDGSACGRAMRSRESVLIKDVMVDPLFAMHRDIAVSAGFRAVQSAPLINRAGTPLGVLSVHFRGPRPLTTLKDLRWLELHAQRATDAIERLRPTGGYPPSP